LIRENEAMQKEIQLQDLMGEPVSAVCFVQDYVELHFDGPILRCLIGPVLNSAEFNGKFPENGSRDALCSLIGQSVQTLSLDDYEKLEVVFASGATLVVPLDSANRTIPEALHFVPRVGGPIQVW
jgi:hypothetical protein